MYRLTWPIGWEQIICFVNVIIKTNFQEGTVKALATSMIAGAPEVDQTEDLKKHKYTIGETECAKNEQGLLIISGYSCIAKCPIRITFWNQTDRCLLQIADDKNMEINGEHAYDRFMDGIEIRGQMDYAVMNSERAHANTVSPKAVKAKAPVKKARTSAIKIKAPAKKTKKVKTTKKIPSGKAKPGKAKTAKKKTAK